MTALTIQLDTDGPVPLYEQLYRYFAGEIQAGRLRTGEKLPSKRALASHLGISQVTVENAYGQLLSEGYLYAKARSGFYVADFVAVSEASGFKTPLQPESNPSPQPGSQPPPGPDPPINFSTAAVDTSLFPYSSYARLTKDIVYHYPALLQRGDGQGDLVLRQALSDLLGQYRGVRCLPGQIVIGAGMEYLITIVLYLFERDTVFGVEDPGYGMMQRAVTFSGHALRYLPVDGDGIHVDALRDSDVQVAYCTPSHQFPMGVTMPAWRRSQLLHWAEHAPGRYIIEDDYDSEFRYGARPVPCMQGMDSAGRVIYIGTFSRSLAPSIRLAYMVLPEPLLGRYKALFGTAQSTVSRYEQAVMARFLSDGLYARYLRKVGNLYRRRHAQLLQTLRTIDGVTVSGADGGLHFLLTNPRYSEAELLRRAAAQGIYLRGLHSYARTCPVPDSTVVVGFGGLRDEVIPEAGERLRQAWK